MRPKRIPLKEEAPLFSYDTGKDKPIVAPENAMVISGNSFRWHKFKNAVMSLVNCELSKEWFWCLTNFLSAVEAAWLEAAAYTAWTWLQLVGSEFSISDAELLAIAWLTSAADSLPYFTWSWTASLTTLTSFWRSLIDDANASAARTTLGLWTLATQSGTFSWTSSWTNTGDQTSIVGITWTKAQFDTACTDGNFAYQSDLSSYLTTSAAAAAYQPLDSDLTAWAWKTAPTWVAVWDTDTQTLTNKTISLASNTLTWTIAQFNTACSDADFATLAWSETLTNKTLTAPVLGTPTSGDLSNCTADGTDKVWFRNIPQNSKSAAYTTVLADAGKHIYHPSADTSARTWTIDSNANVAYPIWTAITFVNDTSGWTITIAITSDTLVLAWAWTTWSRTLAADGVATAIKVTSTRRIISWTWLT